MLMCARLSDTIRQPSPRPMPRTFSYQEAFSRNVGWVTPEEQLRLARARVAIAGLGGVGGVHLLTLARLGLGSFHIADFDRFDLPNFNRQAGAMMSTLDQPKIDVMAAQALDINPEIQLVKFPEGISDANMDSFLADVDVYIDGLDFFAFDARRAVFAACRRKGIPAVTAAPLGMGAAVLTFTPGSMSFDEYFGWGELSDDEKGLRFAIGLAPAFLHRNYLVYPSAVNLSERRGPSTGIACQICAGFAAAQALQLLLGRGNVRPAPHGLQFDAYRGKLVHTWRPFGARNWLQRLALILGRRQFEAMKQAAAVSSDAATRT